MIKFNKYSCLLNFKNALFSNFEMCFFSYLKMHLSRGWLVGWMVLEMTKRNRFSIGEQGGGKIFKVKIETELI